MKILITGGAGFIGSHLADALVSEKHKVTVVDILHPQVHTSRKKPPAYLHKKVEFIKGDICDTKLMKRLLKRVDVVYHLAARVGNAQSMYEINDFVQTNIQGTANILDILVKEKHTVKKLILAASNCGYGEGLYESGGEFYDDVGRRDEADLKKGKYDHYNPDTKKLLNPVPTPEWKALNPANIYSTTKRTQEELCLIAGNTYGIPTTVFRMFNVYGPRQSLNNPYTGVLAIFASRIMNNRPPLVFEDGKQSRDFIHVHDIVSAYTAAMESDSTSGEIINLGTGQARSINEIARNLSTCLGKKISPKILKEYRAGDTRHCTADIQKAVNLLGWSPTMTWSDGLTQFCESIIDDKPKDNTNSAMNELSRFKLRN